MTREVRRVEARSSRVCLDDIRDTAIGEPGRADASCLVDGAEHGAGFDATGFDPALIGSDRTVSFASGYRDRRASGFLICLASRYMDQQALACFCDVLNVDGDQFRAAER